MIRTLKALSLLLEYPSPALAEAAPDLARAIAEEGLVDGARRAAIEALCAELTTADRYALEERYVTLFDRTRTLSLYLFEHVHGESRDRGQAMVDLAALYVRHGLASSARELPDYLPLFLEFLSTLPLAEARAQLARPLHVIAALAERLRRREGDGGPGYACVLDALVAIARVAPSAPALAALREVEEHDPDDLAALDREWEDAAVTFGAGPAPGTGCAAAPGAGARGPAAVEVAFPRRPVNQ